ncbi:MAG: ATP-binding protein, partial [Candidatus Alcyoniella australis]|nr:ATP-binding protein [Candidatus Alcyoniella australis]
GGMAVHVGSGASSRPVIRNIPPTRYDDVRGQNAAVEAVRDYVEMPIKHAEIFKHIGAKGSRGVLLYGAPGNGKTLLAKAVAGESGAHIEIVSGPEALSKWVGEAEERIRAIFERARKLAPSVILFDEIDAIASSRSLAEGHHHKTLVSQLLVLLDGLEDRGHIFVIGTTNRPDDVDPALRRPGRFDRTIHMGPPGIEGRAAIFAKHMAGMKVGSDIDPHELARLTPGFSGAQIELACREAGMACVKETVQDHVPLEFVEVRMDHFEKAIELIIRENLKNASGRRRSKGNGDEKPEAGRILDPHFLLIADQAK